MKLYDYIFFFSESVLVKKQAEQSRKRKLERDIEMELGDDYVLDLKKNYDIPDEYKYDVIPELWEGHNIADYIDPDIFKVSFKLVLCYWLCLKVVHFIQALHKG